MSCLACGYYHTAACTVEGELFAWGKNSDGQLGLGDLHDRGFPHLVGGFGGELLLQAACYVPLARCTPSPGWRVMRHVMRHVVCL